jgi:hypothetical protein
VVSEAGCDSDWKGRESLCEFESEWLGLESNWVSLTGCAVSQTGRAVRTICETHWLYREGAKMGLSQTWRAVRVCCESD